MPNNPTDAERASLADSKSDVNGEQADSSAPPAGESAAVGASGVIATGSAAASGDALGATNTAIGTGAEMSGQQSVQRTGAVVGSATGAARTDSARGVVGGGVGAAALELEDFSDWGAPASVTTSAAGGAISSSRGASNEGARPGAYDASRTPLGTFEDLTAAAFGGGAEHASIRYSITFQDDVGVEWLVKSFEAREDLGEGYQATVVVSTEDPAPETTILLGLSATLLLERGTNLRAFSGIVEEVEDLGQSQGDEHEVTLRLSPAFRVLKHGKNSRVFQKKSTPQILEDVLSAALEPFRRDVRLQLEREYPEHEYRIQYEESDYDFCLRLMADAGIAFWFEDDGERETLVLSDDNGAFYDVEGERGATLTFNAFEAGQDGHEGLRSFEMTSALRPTTLAMRHFDWTHPETIIEEKVDGTEDEESELDGSLLEPKREDYEHDADPVAFSEYSPDQRAYGASEAAAQRNLRREQQRLGARVARGVGNVTGLQAGRVFELVGHQRSELDGRWLIINVQHSGTPSSKNTRYEARFDAIPADTPFRLRRSEKRKAHSIQTAIVVGPAGDEIHTDEHGRVRVQFHWDREGKGDEHSSCFLRVAQPWAGGEWGFVFLPRIGMEVVVSFIHGDPDRPLITGTVYNGLNTPPYPLPDEMTKSLIRTRSTPGGGPDEYNELRFEDKRGEEEVHLQAQKDLTELVKNDHKTTVKGSQTNSVSGGQTESIGGDQSLTVEGNRTHTVEKDETLKVQGKRSHEVTGDESLDVSANRTTKVVGTDELSVTQKRTEKFEAGRETKVTSSDRLEVEGGDRTTKIGGKYHVDADSEIELKQGGNSLLLAEKAHLETSGEMKMTNGPVTIEGSPSGKLSISAGQELELVCGAASITLKPTGEVEIAGTMNVKLAVGANVVEAGPTGVKINGTMVDVAGQAMTTIMGAIVKVN